MPPGTPIASFVIYAGFWDSSFTFSIFLMLRVKGC